MSLDVYLMDPTATYEVGDLFTANITHNLNNMAKEAGIYEALWRPEEIDIEVAEDLIEHLEYGLEKLKSNPEYFKTFNSPNGLGKYEHLVSFVENYLIGIEEFPKAKIVISR